MRVSNYYQIISTVEELQSILWLVCKCRCVTTRNFLSRRFTKLLITIYSLPLDSAVFDSSSIVSGEISSWTTTCANKKKEEKKKNNNNNKN